MELRQLRAFAAVAETMSFTRAADALGLGQSALSQQIAKLEAELGVRLFERTTRQVRLTPAGLEFLQPARQTLYQAESAVAAARSSGAATAGRLALGLVAGLHTEDIAGLLAAFAAAHPEVEITTRAQRSEQSLLDLQNGKLDIAYFYLREGASAPGVGLRPVVTEDVAAVVPTAHPIAAHASTTLADVAAALPFVDFAGGFGLRSLSDEVFHAAGVQRRVAYEVSQGTNATMLIAHGLAAAAVPAATVADAMCAHPPAAGRVRKVPLPPGTGTRTYTLGWLGEQPMSPAGRAFLAHVRGWDGDAAA